MSDHGLTGRILVVDDDAAVLRVVAHALQRAGYTVDIATDGEHALERLRLEQPDVLISDISMPGMGGIELLRRVRQHDVDLPVIFMTGVPEVATAAQALEYGALRYLTKPVTPSVLLPLAEYAVRMSRMAHIKREALAIVGDPGRFVGDRVALGEHFSRALDDITLAYQPIVRWPSNELVGYEALLRSAATAFPNPGAMLRAAEELGRMHDLGRAVRAIAAADAERVPAERRLFVNLHAIDLSDATLSSPAAPLSAFASRITLEITERATLDGIGDVRSRVNALRSMGYQIALDDLGAGYSGLVALAQLQPEVVKLDMALVRDVDTDPTKQKVVGTMTKLSREMGMAVIVEGIETDAERDTLVSLGCDLFQGFLFGRPAPLPVQGGPYS